MLPCMDTSLKPRSSLQAQQQRTIQGWGEGGVGARAHASMKTMCGCLRAPAAIPPAQSKEASAAIRALRCLDTSRRAAGRLLVGAARPDLEPRIR